MKSLRLDRDLVVMLALAVVVALQFLPERLMGLAPFWGDLGYLHHPWRAFDSQLIQAGRVPLWDPYLYFGMPALIRNGTRKPPSKSQSCCLQKCYTAAVQWFLDLGDRP